ncbi:MAG: ROK family protein [Anaerolineae bacterium]|nr:ROK family protein [Anaerolineae bacterium]
MIVPTKDMGVSKTPYSQQKEARHYNTSVVLRDLWWHGPLSRAMLAERSGLTKATVTAISRELLDLGLIRRAGQDRNGPGRPGQLLELDPRAGCAIGLEISTNYAAVVLSDVCGEVLWRHAVLRAVGSSKEVVLAQAEALIADGLEQARECCSALLGIGVGVPGIVDPGPESLVSSSALGWKEVSLKRIWEEKFSVPVLVDNKARAAAMAEALHGSAQGMDSFVYVSLGTDLGPSVEAAVVCDGAPYGGSHGLAVDAGHMILDPQGPLCSCGQRGCWQALANVGREVELILPRLAAGEASVLCQAYAAEGGAPLDHRAIHQAALEGDRLALDVVRQVNDSHAVGITNLVRLFDPEMVVIGWASAALPETFLDRMRALVKISELDVPAAVGEYLARRGVAPPAIVYATHMRDACTLGAAALIVDDFLRKPLREEV